MAGRWLVVILVLFGSIMASIQVYRILTRHKHKTITQIVHEIKFVEKPVPIVWDEVPTYTWRTDTQLFLRALLAQEDPHNERPENPWGITKGFLTDVFKLVPYWRDYLDLTDPEYVGILVRIYLRHSGATTDKHAANIFHKGLTGSKTYKGEYGTCVQNSIWKYQKDSERQKRENNPVPLESLGGKSKPTEKPPLCPMKVAIAANVKVEQEYD